MRSITPEVVEDRVSFSLFKGLNLNSSKQYKVFSGSKVLPIHGNTCKHANNCTLKRGLRKTGNFAVTIEKVLVFSSFL